MPDLTADPADGDNGDFAADFDRATPPSGHVPVVTPGADGPAPGLLAELPRRRGRAGRVIALVALTVVGVAGIGVGGTLLTRELTRGPTNAEKAAAVQQEIASRWQRLPAGKIFTSILSYTTGGLGASFSATLVGIAPPASCASALDPALASLLHRYGCVTVLRATYLDYSGTEAVTIGLVVMKSAAAGNRAMANSASLPVNAGVRTFPLPGTVAAQFGQAQRRYFSTITSIGTYVFLAVAGFTEGRVSGSGSSVASLADLGNSVTTSLEHVMTHHGSACSMKDIRC